jgi:hypothetical protein
LSSNPGVEADSLFGGEVSILLGRSDTLDIEALRLHRKRVVTIQYNKAKVGLHFLCIQ